MDTNAPLRRSTRCRRPTYGVGDVVEITHGSTAGGISIGRLISKIAVGENGFDREDNNSSDEGGTAWIVSFKESSRIAKDEIVAEKAFTRVVKHASPDDDSWRKLLDDSSEEQEEEAVVISVKNGSSGLDKGSDTAQEAPPGAMRRSRRQSSKLLANATKETSSRRSKGDTTTLNSPNASDDKFVDGKGNSKKNSSTTSKARYGTRFARGNSPRNLKRKAAAAQELMLQQQKKKKQQQQKQHQQESKTKGGKRGKKRADSSSDEKEDESVIEVKMNTGILYLHRGLNARAVFVRKY